MKLAEALILRADAQKRISQLQERLVRNARIQEGEAPAEEPQELLERINADIDGLAQLIGRINRTNVAARLEDGLSLADAVTRRDLLMKRREVYVNLAGSAAAREDRYSRSEIRYVSTVDVRELRRTVDRLSQQYRELDTRIQQMNWTVELAE